MAGKAKRHSDAKELTVLADKGYHVGRELQAAKVNNITTVW
jgi:hypothetical protein